MKRAALALVAAALVLGPAPAQSANSYHFPSVVSDYTIASDGSFTVREVRAFTFSGSFHRAFITIPLGDYEIVDAGVSERGVAYKPGLRAAELSGTFAFTRGAEDEIKWFYDATDETRTFTITYRVLRGVRSYIDVAEFNWKFIGDEADARTDRFYATVHLPPGAEREDVKAWGHGPLEGEVRIVDGQTVTYDVPGIPARTFAEGRITFPPALVPGAPAEPTLRLPDVLKAEGIEADRANRARSIAKLWNILAPALALASFGLFLWMFFRYGKESGAKFPGKYLREPPAEYPPAVVGYLMRFGGVKPVDMVATLMDLARRGFLKIEEEHEEKGLIFKHDERHYKITVLKREGDLEMYERELLDLLDEAGMYGSIREDELKIWARANAAKMQAHFKAFEREVNAHAQRLGLVEPRNLVIIANVAAAIVVGAVAVSGLYRQAGDSATIVLFGAGALVVASLVRKVWLVTVLLIMVGASIVGGAVATTPIRNAPGAVIAVVIVAVQAALTPLLRRRSVAGATQWSAWSAFRRFLKDLTRLKEYRPTAVTMWEKYLVYAIPLGAADAVTSAIAINAPEVARQGFAWYAWSGQGGGDGFASSLGSFTTSFTASAQAAFGTSPSSGGGGGGGFSGGSSGGGGGGGAGAS